MRTIIIILYLILYTIVSLPFFLVAAIMGLFNHRLMHCFSQAFVSIGFKGVLLLGGVKLHIQGRENIINEGSAMYVYNHRSFFDAVIGYVIAPRPSAFIAKKSIDGVPLISWWMKFMDGLFLDRDDLKQGLMVISKGIELLEAGTSVFIAPEGTRNHDRELLEFHEASFRLAIKSKRPVIPIVYVHTDEIFENHFPWVHATDVDVIIGEPMYVDGLDRKEKKRIGARLREDMNQTYLSKL